MVLEAKWSKERNEDVRKPCTLSVGGKKTVCFRYTFPYSLQQYVETGIVKDLLWGADNIKECYLKLFGDKFPYRIPGWFNSTCRSIFKSIKIPVLKENIIFKFYCIVLHMLIVHLNIWLQLLSIL